MKVCMVFYDMQELGGLEEYATTLALALQESGNEVSVLSTAWVPPNNQYLQRLQRHDVTYVAVPRWLSDPATDWATKEKLLSSTMRAATPTAYMLAVALYLGTSRPWPSAKASAFRWLQGQLGRWLKPDWRRPIVRQLLNWWRWYWQPDLIHIQGYTSNLLFVLDWAYAKEVPAVYEEHQTPSAELGWWQDFPESINKASRIVAVSDRSAEALRSVCGVTVPIVVRNPLLADPRMSGWQPKRRGDAPDNELTITTVARLDVTKGLIYLIDAAAQVRSRHPNITFRVHGDGRLRSKLLAYAAERGLDGERIFPGPFDHNNLGAIMDETDIFLLTSILEGQPLAIVEAMAYGCPIVATNVGGIPELIEDGVNGLLCEPADPTCLADKLCTLIEDPLLRRRLGREARHAYERGSFQPASLSSQMHTIYQDALGQEWTYASSA